MSRVTENISINKAISQATTDIEAAENAENSIKEKTSAIAQAIFSVSNAKQLIKKSETPVHRFFRILLNLFGIVTDYQKTINKIAKLESAAKKLSKEQIQELTRLKVKKSKKQDKIEDHLGRICQESNEIKLAIGELKKRASKVTDIDKQYVELMIDFSVYKKILADMKPLLEEISEVYQGDIEQFKLIPELLEMHEEQTSALADILEQLNDRFDLRKANARKMLDISPPSFSLPGGIRNGGNTCYLASAMQAINNINTYKNFFNYHRYPLKKRDKETEEFFDQRKKIQKLGFEILKKIQNGTSIKQKEINSFREACYNHTENGKRVIKSLSATADSMEVLGRLLSTLDYEEPPLILTVQHTFHEQKREVLKDRIPDGYSTLEDVKSYSEPFSLQLSAYKYINKGEVPMSDLFKDYLEKELIEDYVLKETDDYGNISCVRYKEVKREKSLDLTKDLPKVLQVTVKQLDGERAKIKDPDVIYPSGKEGVGPRYLLKSVIEHRPGHYVAHLLKPYGIVTANDSLVRKASSSTLPGYGYLYVLDEKSIG